jgi:carboxyl-terminal processing protease
MDENKTSKNNYLIPFSLAFCLALGLFLGNLLTPKRDSSFISKGEAKYTKVRDIIDILNRKYVDSLNGDAIFEQSISDMLHKLDPHSNYIPASDLKAANEAIEGKFGGIGIRFSIIRDTICVTHVIKNSPSEKIGLLSGDRIIQIEKENVASAKITNEKVMTLLKGKENTPVEIVIYRNKKKQKKKIVRGSIPIETVVCATMIDKEIGYIKLDQFSVASAYEFNQAAKTLLSKGMKKLIFDLRNNGGGVLGSATEIVDEFLEENKVIVSTKGKNTKEVIYKSSRKGILKDIQVAVLINSNSASASEIVAGALQDNDRATIVGRRSFGKGLVQEDILLKDGSNLRLTVARYYTPTGRCIQKPYSDDYLSYYNDQQERIENGELYHIDSTLLIDSLKYTTPKGKIVYGGGGILPDVFIPADTNGNSWYFAELRYNGVFQTFAFDYLADKRNKWKNLDDYLTSFQVNNELLNQFVAYGEKYHNITKNEKGFNASKSLIKNFIKAEIARQIWTEKGYYSVMNNFDNEVLSSVKLLKK